jgi:hypothetical protein
VIEKSKKPAYYQRLLTQNNWFLYFTCSASLQVWFLSSRHISYILVTLWKDLQLFIHRQCINMHLSMLF